MINEGGPGDPIDQNSILLGPPQKVTPSDLKRVEFKTVPLPPIPPTNTVTVTGTGTGGGGTGLSDEELLLLRSRGVFAANVVSYDVSAGTATVKTLVDGVTFTGVRNASGFAITAGDTVAVEFYTQSRTAAMVVGVLGRNMGSTPPLVHADPFIAQGVPWYQKASGLDRRTGLATEYFPGPPYALHPDVAVREQHYDHASRMPLVIDTVGNLGMGRDLWIAGYNQYSPGQVHVHNPNSGYNAALSDVVKYAHDVFLFADKLFAIQYDAVRRWDALHSAWHTDTLTDLAARRFWTSPTGSPMVLKRHFNEQGYVDRLDLWWADNGGVMRQGPGFPYGHGDTFRFQMIVGPAHMFAVVTQSGLGAPPPTYYQRPNDEISPWVQLPHSLLVDQWFGGADADGFQYQVQGGTIHICDIAGNRIQNTWWTPSQADRYFNVTAVAVEPDGTVVIGGNIDSRELAVPFKAYMGGNHHPNPQQPRTFGYIPCIWRTDGFQSELVWADPSLMSQGQTGVTGWRAGDRNPISRDTLNLRTWMAYAVQDGPWLQEDGTYASSNDSGMSGQAFWAG